MLVKICGIQTVDDAQSALEAGADFIGFVFANSKRRITPEHAAEIAKTVAPHVKKVGVFVNEDVTNMRSIAETVGLDYIQLHGDEPKAIAQKLSYPVIKAFSADSDLDAVRDYPCDYYLIDSPKGKFRGGTGKTFNWERLNSFSLDRSKLILAGGLHAKNVQEAIRIVNPIGVDVSSGVETNGKKDNQKIKEFIQQAKQIRKDE